MKIAIASNDGIQISKDFFKSNSYKVFSLFKGKIVNEEFRKIKSNTEKDICRAISDCNFFIINNYEQLCDDMFGEDEDKAFVKTEEILITNIIQEFMEEQNRLESNFTATHKTNIELQTNMKDNYCPNFRVCQLLNTDLVTNKQELKNKYKEEYCISSEKHWKNCKRFITRRTLNFCPDFVFPDTELSPMEIINKYDKETTN